MNAGFDRTPGTILWDAHSCVPLTASYRLESLHRHRDAGFDYVSINVGMDANSVARAPNVNVVCARLNKRSRAKLPSSTTTPPPAPTVWSNK